MNDTPQLFDQKTVKARKKHKCCECGVPIMIGDEYSRISGLWDGEFSKFAQCLMCAAISERLGKGVQDWEDGFGYGCWMDYYEGRMDVLPDFWREMTPVQRRNRVWNDFFEPPLKAENIMVRGEVL